MKAKGRTLWLLAFWSLAFCAWASAANLALTTCKPCGATPLEVALDNAEGIALGRVVQGFAVTKKKESGEGTLSLNVQKWLRRPSPASSKITVHFAWDGACRLAPPAFKSGQKLVLFLTPSLAPNRGSGAAWEASANPCALTHLLPQGSDYADLKRRLAKTAVD